MSGFVSLHNHCWASNLRFLDCINRPKEMVARALELGFAGIAFTDHEALSAAVEILKVRDSIKKDHPEFKIIFGNEIYLVDDSALHNTRDYYHFILLAKDVTGWDQLRALSSRAWERGYTERGVMRVPTTKQDIEEIVGGNPGHLLASSACLGGELPKAILAHDVSGANSFVKWCIGVFGKENVALEMQPSDNEEQTIVNRAIIKLATHYQLPYIVTTDSHYLLKSDFAIHSAFLNSKQSNDRETDKFYRFTYMMSEDEMREILTSNGVTEEEAATAISNTAAFTEAIQEFDFRHTTIVPKIKLLDFTLARTFYGHPEYSAINAFYDSTDPQDRFLMYQIERGIAAKQINVTPSILERINIELDVLLYIGQQINQSLSAYLNLTVNIIDIAWQVSLVGPGRGSACGFYINYLIGITQVDPLTYDLAWWRFLNKERAELPDVDEDFQPEKTAEIVRLLREAYGEDNVLNCATFKTESLKSAILSAGRGLGYNNDEMSALAGMVPEHRGQFYTLDECLNGNEEKGYDPVPEFATRINHYPGLFDAVKKIEGLPTNPSIHASALYVFNDGYLAQNSLMRAPNKTKITAFSMHASDELSALKMDVLRTDAESKIAKCMELLLADGLMEWQGSLRATYDKYLHPNVLDYENPAMWEQMSSGKIANLFQFETQVGSVCIKKARPTTVRELAEINSIMRLQADEGEQPIDRYVRFRNDPEVWDLEMAEEGLTDHEMEILKKYLSKSYGVSGSQEVLMQILMDPEVCDFTLGEANAARKAIAKKVAAKLIQLKKDFEEKGARVARQEFLNYVWKYCIEPQLGYSFSINHTLPYSVIAIQEANLATRWSPLYWQCACLCVNSGSYAGDMGDDEEDESVDEETDVEESAGEEVVKRHVAPNYGKIARAISDAQLAGVHIELPDINRAQEDFVPDVENNSILYSLRAINVVSEDLMETIIANRPYTGIKSFFYSVHPTTTQMIGLIKAGCFDALEKQPRRVQLLQFLQLLADEKYPLKDKLTIVQVKKAIELGWRPEWAENMVRMVKYHDYVTKNCLDSANKRLVLSGKTYDFFKIFFEKQLNLTKNEYSFLPDGTVAVKQAALKRVYEKSIAPVIEFFNTDEGRSEFRRLQQGEFINDMMANKCGGTPEHWEFETMCFYSDRHELTGVSRGKYNVGTFSQLSEKSDNKTRPVAMVGVVADTNNTRHIVTLLTPDGIVDVKFWAGAYSQYNQRISKVDPKTKKKTVVDESWLKRGNRLIIYGVRSENMFRVRRDNSAGFSRMVGLIENVHGDGSLDIRWGRNSR